MSSVPAAAVITSLFTVLKFAFLMAYVLQAKLFLKIRIFHFPAHYVVQQAEAHGLPNGTTATVPPARHSIATGMSLKPKRLFIKTESLLLASRVHSAQGLVRMELVLQTWVAVVFQEIFHIFKAVAEELRVAPQPFPIKATTVIVLPPATLPDSGK